MNSENDIVIEEVKPEFAGAQFQPKHRLYRFNYGELRFYYRISPEGAIEFLPSWTTVIGATLKPQPGLVKWIAGMGYDEAMKYRDERAEYGTFLHTLAAEFLLGKMFKIDYQSIFERLMNYKKGNLNGETNWIWDIQSDMLAFAKFCNDRQIEPLAIEMPLAADCGVAGTLDIACELNFDRKRIRAIIDIKSGRKGFFENNQLQLEGYRIGWNDNFPNYPIDEIFNWSPADWRTEPNYHFVCQTGKASLSKLEYLVGLFKIDNPHPKSVKIISGELKLGIDTSANFQTIDIESFIKKRHPERLKSAAKIKEEKVEQLITSIEDF